MAKIVFESEAELEMMIFSAQQEGHCLVIDERVDDCFRQQHIGTYGISDLLTVQYETDSAGVPYAMFTIYEIKKEVIKNDAVAQLARYIKGLNHILSDFSSSYQPYVRGVLVAPDLDLSGDTCFLCDLLEDIEIYTAEWDVLTGLKFNNRGGWHREQESLCSNTGSMLNAVQLSINALTDKKPILEVCK